MKLILFITLLVVALAAADIADLLNASDEVKAEVRVLANECYEETGTNVREVDLLQSFILVNDRAVKCFLACYFKKYGSMKEDGKWDIVKVKPLVTPKNYTTLEFCIGETILDHCEKAYDAYNCYLRKYKVINVNDIEPAQ